MLARDPVVGAAQAGVLSDGPDVAEHGQLVISVGVRSEVCPRPRRRGAQAAWLGTRFLLAEESPIHEKYRRRVMEAAETDAQWYADLYDVGWPDAPH